VNDTGPEPDGHNKEPSSYKLSRYNHCAGLMSSGVLPQAVPMGHLPSLAPRAQSADAGVGSYKYLCHNKATQ
jgi:hypothetical protein